MIAVKTVIINMCILSKRVIQICGLELRISFDFLHCSILSKRIYGIDLRYLIHKFMFYT